MYRTQNGVLLCVMRTGVFLHTPGTDDTRENATVLASRFLTQMALNHNLYLVITALQSLALTPSPNSIRIKFSMQKSVQLCELFPCKQI